MSRQNGDGRSTKTLVWRTFQEFSHVPGGGTSTRRLTRHGFSDAVVALTQRRLCWPVDPDDQQLLWDAIVGGPHNDLGTPGGVGGANWTAFYRVISENILLTEEERRVSSRCTDDRVFRAVFGSPSGPVQAPEFSPPRRLHVDATREGTEPRRGPPPGPPPVRRHLPPSVEVPPPPPPPPTAPARSFAEHGYAVRPVAAAPPAHAAAPPAASLGWAFVPQPKVPLADAATSPPRTTAGDRLTTPFGGGGGPRVSSPPKRARRTGVTPRRAVAAIADRDETPAPVASPAAPRTVTAAQWNRGVSAQPPPATPPPATPRPPSLAPFDAPDAVATEPPAAMAAPGTPEGEAFHRARLARRTRYDAASQETATEIVARFADFPASADRPARAFAPVDRNVPLAPRAADVNHAAFASRFGGAPCPMPTRSCRPLADAPLPLPQRDDGPVGASAASSRSGSACSSVDSAGRPRAPRSRSQRALVDAASRAAAGGSPVTPRSAGFHGVVPRTRPLLHVVGSSPSKRPDGCFVTVGPAVDPATGQRTPPMKFHRLPRWRPDGASRSVSAVSADDGAPFVHVVGRPT